MSAFAILPNQGRFPLSEALFRLRDASQQAKDERDARIRHALSQFAPSAINATLTYEHDGETQLVRITPNQARKAALFDDVHQTLVTAPPYIDAKIALAWEILWSHLHGTLKPAHLALYRQRVTRVLERPYRRDEPSFSAIHQALSRCEGSVPREAPRGF
jgi:hypothetical protein